MVAQISEMSAKYTKAVFVGMLGCWNSEMSAIAVFLAPWWIVLKKCQNKCGSASEAAFAGIAFDSGEKQSVLIS